MKKKRGYTRQLKREMLAMKQAYDLLLKDYQASVEKERDYYQLKGRIQTFSEEWIVNPSTTLEYYEKGHDAISELKLKTIHSMASYMTNCVKVERDMNFLGVGSKYKLSLTVLQ